jgi:hypothetical protein
VEIGRGFTPAAAANLCDAVHGGLNYLGLCAGAFFAGDSPYNGVNLTSGVRCRFYSVEDRGIRKTAVPITTPSGLTLDHYWQDGPHLSGWGEVVARYPTERLLSHKGPLAADGSSSPASTPRPPRPDVAA